MMSKLNIRIYAQSLAIYMGLFLFWKAIYPYGCVAWLIPLVIFGFVLLGIFHNIQHMDYMKAKVTFKESSIFYKLFTQRPINFIKAVFNSFALIIFPSIFVMGAGMVDFMFIMFTSLITFLFYQMSFKLSQKHLNTNSMTVGHKLLAFITTSVVITILYMLSLYYLIPVPHFVDLTSIENTITNASQEVGSLCVISNFLVKFTQETTAIAWFFMVSTSQTSQVGIGPWILFLFLQALSFYGLSRIQIEILHTLQILKETRT